jgi:hypothetical protein
LKRAAVALAKKERPQINRASANPLWNIWGFERFGRSIDIALSFIKGEVFSDLALGPDKGSAGLWARRRAIQSIELNPLHHRSRNSAAIDPTGRIALLQWAAAGAVCLWVVFNTYQWPTAIRYACIASWVIWSAINLSASVAAARLAKRNGWFESLAVTPLEVDEAVAGITSAIGRCIRPAQWLVLVTTVLAFAVPERPGPAYLAQDVGLVGVAWTCARLARYLGVAVGLQADMLVPALVGGYFQLALSVAAPVIFLLTIFGIDGSVISTALIVLIAMGTLGSVEVERKKVYEACTELLHRNAPIRPEPPQVEPFILPRGPRPYRPRL